MNRFLTVFFLIVSMVRVEAVSEYRGLGDFCNTFVSPSSRKNKYLQCAYVDKESLIESAGNDLKFFLNNVGHSSAVKIALQIPGQGEFVLEQEAFGQFMSRLEENKSFKGLGGVTQTGDLATHPCMFVFVNEPAKFQPLVLVGLFIFCCCRRGHRLPAE